MIIHWGYAFYINVPFSELGRCCAEAWFSGCGLSHQQQDNVFFTRAWWPSHVGGNEYLSSVKIFSDTVFNVVVPWAAVSDVYAHTRECAFQIRALAGFRS